MVTKAKSNSVITAHPDPEAQTLTFKVLGVGDIVLNLAGVGEGVRIRALYHGLTQRVSDAAAIPFNKETGKYATPQEKYEAMRALVEHYNAGGDWARGRAAGGARVGGETALILRALAEHQGLEVEAMRERVKILAEKRETTPRAYLASVLAAGRAETSPLGNVVTIYERLRAEQPVAGVKIDADELMGDLSGE